MDNKTLRATELYQLKNLAKQAGIRFVSTTKLGPYGLPTHARLEFAELFETVNICPYPNKTDEAPTFLKRAIQNERSAQLPALKKAQGNIINLYDQDLCLMDRKGKPLLNKGEPIIIKPETATNGRPYLETALPHKPLFKVARGVSLDIT